MIPGIVYFYPAHTNFKDGRKKWDGQTDRQTDGQKSELGKGPQNKISLKNQNNQ